MFETELPDGYFGVIKDLHAETDYELAGGDLVLPKPRQTFWDKKTEYNQLDVWNVSCTIHGAMGAYTDQSGHVFDLDHRKKLWEIAVQEGANPAIGWYVNKAVDATRKYGNLLSGTEMMSFRVNVGKSDFFDVLDKGYTVVISFNGNQAYNIDKLDNGVLDGLTFGVSTYGHCVRIVKNIEDNTYLLIVDNYPTSKHNKYKLDRSHLDKLVTNKVFGVSGYIFVNKQDWTAINNPQYPLWATSAISKAMAKGLIDKDTNLNHVIGDAELEDWFFKLGLLTVKSGSLNLMRMLVVAERMGKL